MNIIISELLPADWNSVREIYLEGIKTGNATFENTAPTWEEWTNRHLPTCRLVAREEPGGAAIGWAALSAYSRRQVYVGVAEESIYVSQPTRGKGIGKVLLNHLIDQSEKEGIWTLQAGIFPENKPSLALHQRCGFRVVGTRERIGKMGGIWRDVLLLERRSQKTGMACPGEENND